MLLDVAKLPREGEAFDVVVIGAGGAGLSAALFAAIDGARVLLVERTEYVGGTTAYSGGTTWIPGTRHAASVSKGDTLENAETYLQRAIGDRTPPALRKAFLEHGPAVVDHVEANSEVKYRAYPLHPDYLSELEGSTVNGRALEPLPFDGRKLGKLLALVRPPIPEFTVLGGMMVDRNDIFHLLRMTKTLASFRHSAKILGRHLADRMRHKRGTRLVMGNALVGRLLYSLAQRKNVALAINTAVDGNHQRHLRRTSSFPAPEWRTPNRARQGRRHPRERRVQSSPSIARGDAARRRSGLVSGCARAYRRGTRSHPRDGRALWRWRP